jgi:3-oxoacyl-[acyl-carrier protein] reductase
MTKLAGKVALVSGSGRGIGRNIAFKLASEGARLLVNDRDEEPAAETVALIRAQGGEAEAHVGDVTHPDFGTRFVEKGLSAFGGLDIIVNNAGYTLDGVIQKQTDAQFQAMLDVHLVAPFRILRAAIEPIRILHKQDLQNGRDTVRKIVNISSIVGVRGNPGQVNYAAAKAGLIGMTKTLAKEWGRYRTCVNSVAFGFIETRLTQPRTSSSPADGGAAKAGMPAEKVEAVRALIPFGRLGTPEEAAGGVYLLCISESDYVSGEVLVVGGGLSL